MIKNLQRFYAQVQACVVTRYVREERLDVLHLDSKQFEFDASVL